MSSDILWRRVRCAPCAVSGDGGTGKARFPPALFEQTGYSTAAEIPSPFASPRAAPSASISAARSGIGSAASEGTFSAVERPLVPGEWIEIRVLPSNERHISDGLGAAGVSRSNDFGGHNGAQEVSYSSGGKNGEAAKAGADVGVVLRRFLCQAWPWTAAPAVNGDIVWCAFDRSCELDAIDQNQLTRRVGQDPAEGSDRVANTAVLADNLGACERASDRHDDNTASWLDTYGSTAALVFRLVQPTISATTVRLRLRFLSPSLLPVRDAHSSAVAHTLKHALLRRAVSDRCAFGYSLGESKGGSAELGSSFRGLSDLKARTERPPASIELLSTGALPGQLVLVALSTDVVIDELVECDPSPTAAGDAMPPHETTPWTEAVNFSPPVRFAGLQRAFQRLAELVTVPVRHQSLVCRLMPADGPLRLPRGALIHGPSGCGKSLLLEHLAFRCNASVLTLPGTSLHSTTVGEAESTLKRLFKRSEELAGEHPTRPVFVVIDGIDALGTAQSSSEGAHRARAVAQLTALIDDNFSICDRHIFVFGVASLVREVAPALRQSGRLDRDIEVTVPDLVAREELLSIHAAHVLETEEEQRTRLLREVAMRLPGYTGADVRALCREAVFQALRRMRMQKISAQSSIEDSALTRVGFDDFQTAINRVPPSTQRAAMIDIPPVRWDDIGGLKEVKERLRRAVEWPLLHAEAFARLHLRPPRGILLHGPPGCSKTMLARAAATEAHASFVAISGASIFSQWVGDAEAAIRNVFARARLGTPAIVFLDEIEALVGSRATGEGADRGGTDVHERVLTTLLNEMDGIEHCDGVLVLAATNRIDLVDDALLRPGRIDEVLLVPPPDLEGRVEILRIKTRNMPLSLDFELEDVARRTDCWTGAELENLCREAALVSLRSDINAPSVGMMHFDSALSILGARGRT